MTESELRDTVSIVKEYRTDLQNDDIFRKKKALQDLNKVIFPENSKHSQTTLHTAFSECYLQVLKCFRDKSEMCRELAIQLMSNFIQNLELNDFYLTYVFPVIVERIGTPELIEESEELRLELINFLTVINKRYSKSEYLVPFLNDFVQILCQTVIDKFPKAKEASCKCIMELATALPKHFHMQCENFIKPVMKSFTHQHYKIRVIAIQTIGVITLNSTSGNVMETVVGPLAEKLFDQIPVVRRAVIQVTARFLMEYRDRYSHFYRLLPLILTGLSDEIPETREEAEVLWKQVGAQFEKENEKDLKDQLDYPVGAVENYPSDVIRPRLGCRILVQRNSSKIIPALRNELSSWQEDIRVRCAQLLCVVMLHCEEFATQGLQDILPTMYAACEYKHDQDKAVHENIMHAAKFIGTFVPIKAWSILVLPAITDTPTCGHLRILRSMVSGTSRSDLAKYTVEVANLLSSEAVRSASRKPLYLNELIECCRTMIWCTDISGQIFTIIVTVIALCTALTNSEEAAKVSENARQLAKEISEPEKYIGDLLENLINNDTTLVSSVSPDRCIFDTLLLEWSNSLAPHLSMVAEVLNRVLNERCDPEARLKTFQALIIFLEDNTLEQTSAAGDGSSDISTFVHILIRDTLLGTLVWHAGRTAEALRTAAACCLTRTLHHAQPNLIAMDDDFNTILSTLISLLDDPSWRTRMFGARALAQFGQLLGDDEARQRRWANDTVLALLKRMDDPNDQVRLKVMITLKEVLQWPNLLEPQNARHLIDTVLTHLDDEGNVPRNAALEILRAVARGDWTYLYEKLQNDKQLFRNKDICEELIQYLNSLNTKV